MWILVFGLFIVLKASRWRVPSKFRDTEQHHFFCLWFRWTAIKIKRISKLMLSFAYKRPLERTVTVLVSPFVLLSWKIYEKLSERVYSNFLMMWTIGFWVKIVFFGLLFQWVVDSFSSVDFYINIKWIEWTLGKTCNSSWKKIGIRIFEL